MKAISMKVLAMRRTKVVKSRLFFVKQRNDTL